MERLLRLRIAALAAACTVSIAARSEEPACESSPSATFVYTTSAQPRPIRAALEIGAVLTLGFAWYATTAPTVHEWDPGYRWNVFRRKVTFENFGFDANSLGTNFIGHPLGGTGYYLAARSNRLTILQSLSLSIAGSALWELFGEVSEIVSLNDMVVTPLAGLSIGEATLQLGSFFDRRPKTASHLAFGTAFGPFKTLNDRLDGLELARSEPDEWHRFHAEVAASLVRQDSAEHSTLKWWPEGRFGLSSHLVRLPGYDVSGRGTSWFDDGNVSSIDLAGAFGAAGLSDLMFSTEVVLAGGYYRARERDEEGAAWGANGVAGFTSGFEYAVHQYRRREGRAVDRMASVRPLGIYFEQRGAIGGPTLSSVVAAGPLFGGVTPNALGGYRGPAERLPAVQSARGYYFGVGAHLRAALSLEDGPISARAELASEGFRDVRGPHATSGVGLSDLLLRYGAAVGFERPNAVAPSVFVERRERIGWIDSVRERVGEVTFGSSIGGTF